MARFHCSKWYRGAQPYLLHRQWIVTTVAELVAKPEEVQRRFGPTDEVFVRPDSPLKPFSGRVLRCSEISLKTLDHGFYYDDVNLPIIVAPVRSMTLFAVFSLAVMVGSHWMISAP